MPYSSVRKCGSRDERESLSDNPGEGGYHDYSSVKRDYAFLGVSSIPRSSPRVDRELQQLLARPSYPNSFTEYNSPEWHDDKFDNYTCASPNRTTTDHGSLTRKLAALKIGKGRGFNKSCAIEQNNPTKTTTDMGDPARAGFVSKMGHGVRCETTQIGREGEPSKVINQPKVIQDMHINAHGYGDIGETESTLSCRGAKPRRMNGMEEAAQATILEDKKASSEIWQDPIHKSSSLREIGSWVLKDNQLDGSKEPDSTLYQHPNFVDLDEGTSSYLIRDNKIFECAGSKSSGRSNTRGRGTPSTRRPTSTEKTSNRQHKGKGRQIDKFGNEDGDDLEEENKSDGNIVFSKSFKFRCPFFLLYPDKCKDSEKYGYKFRTCTSTEFPDTTRLKEHLYRCHRQPIRCPRCQESFDENILLTTHLSKVTRCQTLAGDFLDLSMYFDLSTEVKLRRRTSVQNPVEKWKEIYAIIFPNETVPSLTCEELSDAVSPGTRDSGLVVAKFLHEMPAFLESELGLRVHQLDLSAFDKRRVNEQISLAVKACQMRLWTRYQQQQQQQQQQEYSSRPSETSHEESPKSNTSSTFHSNTSPSSFIQKGDVYGQTELGLAAPSRHIPLSIAQTQFPLNLDIMEHPMIGVSSIYCHRGQLPATPDNDGTSTIFNTVNIEGPLSSKSLSWHSDSGVGTLPSCEGWMCDASSCGECLKLMKSPTSEKLQLSDSFLPGFIPLPVDRTNHAYPLRDQSLVEPNFVDGPYSGLYGGDDSQDHEDNVDLFMSLDSSDK